MCSSSARFSSSSLPAKPVISAVLGLKPSKRSHVLVRVITRPRPSRGMCSSGRSTRKPVTVSLSSVRKRLDGHGSMQCSGSRFSQPVVTGISGPASSGPLSGPPSTGTFT